jgi:hypothetical protein
MPDENPIEFTKREQFVLNYFGSPELSGSLRAFLYDIAIGLASIACIVKFATSAEVAYGFIGYALVAGRLFYLVVEGSRWSRDYRSIFAKYDAKLRELTEAQKRKDTGRDVA